MTERTDLGALLGAANPLDSYAMSSSDLDEMVRRVIAGPVRPRHEGRIRRRHVRTASIVVAFALTVMGVVVGVTLGSGHELQALSLKSVQLSFSSKSASIVVHGYLGHKGPRDNPTPPGITFVAGPALSAGTTLAPVYSYGHLSDPTSALTLVANMLGIVNPVTRPGNDGCGTEVGGHSALVWSNCSEPVGWTYNIRLPACKGLMKDSAGLLVPCPVAWGFTESGATQDELAAWSASDAASVLPTGLTLGLASYGRNSVSYPCEFDGVAIIGCTENFQYSDAGELLYASGPLDPVSPITSVGSYPLISPVQGVAQMNQSAAPLFSHGSGPISPSSVTLSTSTVVYATATLTDGTTVLLPAFLYLGSDGGHYSTDAVAPALLSEGASS
jgi:hypothetical protein